MEDLARRRADGRPKISGFVVTYNRAYLLETCLRSIRFVDELVVVDKSSTDDTPRIAARYADKLITVPWSPWAEGTRPSALAACSHDWIAFLDDDESFNPAAIRFILAEAAAPRAEAYRFPMRHYMLGRHDERAYYWPEAHERFFRRGAIEFPDVVHGGVQLLTDKVHEVPSESGACVRNLTRPDLADAFAKSNRFTDHPNRRSLASMDGSLADIARERLDRSLAGADKSRLDPAPNRLKRLLRRLTGAQRTDTRTTRDKYLDAVALVGFIGDLMDVLKRWETAEGIDGRAAYAALCADFQREYDALEREGIATLALGVNAP